MRASTRKKLSASTRESFKDPCRREASRQAFLGQYHKESTKKTLSEKMRELWKDPEYRKRQSKSHKGKHQTEEVRRKKSLAMKRYHVKNPDAVSSWHRDNVEKSHACAAAARAKSRFRNTRPERAVESILVDLGVEFHSQFRINDFYHEFDFAIPKLKLLIEVDGCVWHGCEMCHPNPSAKMRAIVEKQMARDRLANYTVSQSEWHLVRFWSHDVLGHIKSVRDRLGRLVRLRDGPWEQDMVSVFPPSSNQRVFHQGRRVEPEQLPLYKHLLESRSGTSEEEK